MTEKTQLGVWFTPAEREKIEAHAGARQMSLGGFVRLCVIEAVEGRSADLADEVAVLQQRLDSLERQTAMLTRAANLE